MCAACLPPPCCWRLCLPNLTCVRLLQRCSLDFASPRSLKISSWTFLVCRTTCPKSRLCCLSTARRGGCACSWCVTASPLTPQRLGLCTKWLRCASQDRHMSPRQATKMRKVEVSMRWWRLCAHTCSLGPSTLWLRSPAVAALSRSTSSAARAHVGPDRFWRCRRQVNGVVCSWNPLLLPFSSQPVAATSSSSPVTMPCSNSPTSRS
mmetsp:Transcript_27295/g.90731  ORF Transcript_27295/g.90731 Transcript_27295/m.90731 type:complete len:207 (+) Transcript_27295:218-838(+)